jgi:hypothetical protein
MNLDLVSTVPTQIKTRVNTYQAPGNDSPQIKDISDSRYDTAVNYSKEVKNWPDICDHRCQLAKMN